MRCQIKFLRSSSWWAGMAYRADEGIIFGVISLCNFGHVYPVQLCIAIIMIIIHYNHHHYPKWVMSYRAPVRAVTALLPAFYYKSPVGWTTNTNTDTCTNTKYKFKSLLTWTTLRIQIHVQCTLYTCLDILLYIFRFLGTGSVHIWYININRE